MRGLFLLGTRVCCRGTLAMRQSVANRAGRAGDIEHLNDSFQFVMAGFVKEVAETDYSYSFSDEVHCQARG